jgi:hypothetical protein
MIQWDEKSEQLQGEKRSITKGVREVWNEKEERQVEAGKH